MAYSVSDVAAIGTNTTQKWWIRTGLVGPRVRLPAMLFWAVMLLFSAQRLCIYLTMHDRFRGVSARAIAGSFAIGLRFDAAIAFMLSLPLIIVAAATPGNVIVNRAYGWIVSTFGGVAIAVTLFACVADYYFYQEFGLRLNYQVLEYTRYSAIYRTIWDQYPVVWASLATLIFLSAATWALNRWGLGQPRRSPWWQVVWPALLIPVAIIGIRGSLRNRPMNSSAAYSSDSPALVQLTLNGCYTLRDAVYKHAHDSNLKDIFALLDDAEALARAKQLLGQANDQFFDDADNPLRRVTITGRPRNDYNVVLVVLESTSWQYIGALGGDARLTPNLSALAEQSVLMDHCFSVGQRTAQGLSGSLAGFPDLPGSGVITRPQSEGKFLTLARILCDRGYSTIYVHGGQPEFDHQLAFCASNGYDRCVFEDQLPCRTFRNVLGWCDEDAYNSVDRIASETTDRPFFISLMTTSFHRPYLIPAGKIQSVQPGHPKALQMDAVHYADWAIGQFMAKVRQAKYFERTIFVFTGDHAGGFMQTPVVPGGSSRVPFIVYAPAILGPPRRVPAVCSQADIPPTILSLLGGSYEHCFFGSSVLDRPADRGMALIQSGSSDLMLVKGENVMMIPPYGAKCELFRLTLPMKLDRVDLAIADQSAKAKEMTRDATALLQSADILFRRGSYNLPTTRPAPKAEPAAGSPKN